MKDPVLDIEAEETRESASARGASDRGNLEKRLTERMDVRLEEIKKGIADGLTRT